MPLDHNGKVDRAALAASAAASDSAAVAPTAGTGTGTGTGTDGGPAAEDRLIAEVWSEVLGVDPVRPADNFFDLGGHSILAIKMVARLRDRLLVELPPSAIFDFPTVAELAELVRTSRSTRE
jgi:acyl carrier protein